MIRRGTIEDYMISQARRRPSFEDWVTNVHHYIKWIGTHAEYTALCKKNQQYSVDNY
jgi:hypothetical protein